MLRRLTVLLPLLVLTGACRDSTGPGAVDIPAPPAAETGYTVARLDCTVQVQPGSIDCREPGPAPAAQGPSRVIYGSGQVKMASANVVYDSVTQIFSMDATAQNLRSTAIGTVDGTTVAFIKVFFHLGPNVTAYKAPGDTGTVTVRNADGYCNCSAARQPYHSYPQILQPQQVSAPKRWEWNVPRTVSTFNFQVFVFTRYVGEPDVPPIAPDTVPESIYNPARIAHNDPVLSGPLLRDVVLVMFEPGATAEDRLVAVNRTNGTVVGGRRIAGGDGMYVIKLPDNGTTANLREALNRLDVLPQVSFASPEYVFQDSLTGDHLFSDDGNAGWLHTDWSLAPDTTAGPNWGLEAIQAPMAWGCTTGSDQVKVAVIDDGFKAHHDMTSVLNDGWQRSTPNNHGLLVASVIGADGNNGTGATGVMWNVGLKYHVHSRPNSIRSFFGISEMNQALADAIWEGARVVNVSRKIGYTDSLGNPRAPTTSRADTDRALRVGKSTARTISRAVSNSGNDPLIVFSAGNYGVESLYNGYPNALNDLPTRVLVVAAAAQAPAPGQGDYGGSYVRGVWGGPTSIEKGSSYGSLVQIAAPGVDVGVLSNTPLPVVRTGTSMAAPYVAGVAGLLASLDPRLTAAELKTFLLNGATQGGRSIQNGPGGGPIPLVNAYRSLRLVAERQGAGLCGNPVWQDSTGAVFARRGSRWAGPTEQIFSYAQNGLSLNHGSMTATFQDFAVFKWANSRWDRSSEPYTADNATDRSLDGMSHTVGDTSVYAVRNSGPNPRYDEDFSVVMNGQVLATIRGPRVNHMPTVYRCVAWLTTGNEYTDCVQQWGTWSAFVTSDYTVSYSSARNEVVLAVSRDSSAATIEEPFYFYGGYYQRNYAYDYTTFDTHLYFIPVANPGAVRTIRIAGDQVNRLGFSEDGKQVVMRRVNRFQSDSFTPAEDFHTAHHLCKAHYAEVLPTQLTNLFTVPFVRNTNECYRAFTFAP